MTALEVRQPTSTDWSRDVTISRSTVSSYMAETENTTLLAAIGRHGRPVIGRSLSWLAAFQNHLHTIADQAASVLGCAVGTGGTTSSTTCSCGVAAIAGDASEAHTALASSAFLQKHGSSMIENTCKYSLLQTLCTFLKELHLVLSDIESSLQSVELFTKFGILLSELLFLGLHGLDHFEE